MHLFDSEQHVLVEVAGTAVFLVGVGNVVGLGLPYATELDLATSLVLVALGLLLMGYKKLARRVVALRSRTGP